MALSARRLLALGAVLAGLLAVAPHAGAATVSAFYYPWFGTPSADGDYEHWAQRGHVPPDDIAADFYPARGLYSSSSASVIDSQMRELAKAGVDEVVVSWWGRGTVEDRRLPAVIAAARKRKLTVAVHLEPYGGRTVENTVADALHLRQAHGVRVFYVFQPFDVAPAEWAAANETLRARGLTVFAQTPLAGAASAGGFSGLYTYDVLVWGGDKFARICAQARARKLLCAPSVGPGFDARRATGETRVKPRRDGATYDSMWRAAVKARADLVTITSYNEWQEGTQVEAAAPASRRGGLAYQGYDGAWGLQGAAARTAYLDRTAHWAQLFRRQLRG